MKTSYRNKHTYKFKRNCKRERTQITWGAEHLRQPNDTLKRETQNKNSIHTGGGAGGGTENLTTR